MAYTCGPGNTPKFHIPAALSSVAQRTVLFIIGSLAYWSADVHRIQADDARPAADADIITAIDVSSSVTRLKRMVAFTGLANAVMDPAFLAKVSSGPSGRVGFAAFTWSDDGTIDLIVPWMLITTRDDAAKAATRFLHAIEVNQAEQFVVRRTDVAFAINAASEMARASPFASRHTFINICSDGASNSGAAPSTARDHALTEDVTISAILLGSQRALVEYYTDNVIGGSGAFILPIQDAAAMSKLLSRKFWLDLAS